MGIPHLPYPPQQSSGLEDLLQEARSIFQQATPMVEEELQLLQAVEEQQSQQEDTLSEVAQELSQLPQLGAVSVPLVQIPSTDGTLYWRVRIPAVNDAKVVLQSLPFYTGRTGYKMCVRAVFRGSTSGNELRLSVYFTIMRGEYDCFLKWPFSSRVSIILVDPNNRKHIVKILHPDPKSRSYSYPASETNIPIGFPNFASVSENYVRENSALLKCIVDTSNIIHP